MSWLDEVLDQIKSGQIVEGQPGEIISQGLEAIDRTINAPVRALGTLASNAGVVPFPGVYKGMTGQDVSQYGDQGGVLNPMPDLANDVVHKALTALKNYSPDLGKLAEDTMINSPFMGPSLVKSPGYRASSIAEKLVSEGGSITPKIDGLLKMMRGIKEKVTNPINDLKTDVTESLTKSAALGEPLVKEAIPQAKAAKPIDPAIEAIEKPSALSSRIKSFLDDNVTDRDLGRGIIREQQGRISQQQAQEGHRIAAELANWYSRSKEDSQTFIRRMEKGELNKIADPNSRVAAYELANGWLKRRKIVEELGEKDGKNYFEAYVKNFFPHMFKDSKLAASIFDRITATRTAAEGDKAFLKERNIDSFDEAIDLYHLEPKSWNPIELGLMKNAEIDRFIMAHNIKNQFQDTGLIKEIGKDTDIPRDWVKLNDSVFNGAQFFAPADVAKDFNHYFSPGLMGNPLYDMVRGVSNTMTQAQLGLSGFHAIFESLESGVSDLALAGQYVKEGQFGKAAVPLARAGTIVGPAIRDFAVGRKVYQEYLKPGSYSEYARTVEAIKQGGGGLMDPIYINKSINSMKEAARDGNWPKAIAKSIPAFFEMTAKPIMEWYVPKLKLGLMDKMTSRVLDKASREGWDDNLTRREIQKNWDSVDNRMGQLRYSNLFWHKAAKDLALISFRAPGWALGTVRELGGGMLDLTQQSGRAIAERKFDLTNRMAYSMALPIFAGYIGGLVNFLMTGQMPKEAKDYYYPRDGTTDNSGNPNRIQIPSYIKDVQHIKNKPVSTVLGKLNPGITASVDLLNNKDFYNTEIRHPDDPLAMQGIDTAKYLAEQMTPFSLRNYKQRGGAINDSAIGNLIQSLVGILPAPREFIKTPAQNLTDEYIQRHIPAGPATKEERENKELRQQLEGSFRRGQIGIGDLVKNAAQGKITHDQLDNIVRFKNLPTIAREIKMLSAEEAMKVYGVADEKERRLIRGEVRKIVARQLSKDPQHRNEWAEKLLSIR